MSMHYKFAGQACQRSGGPGWMPEAWKLTCRRSGL